MQVSLLTAGQLQPQGGEGRSGAVRSDYADLQLSLHHSQAVLSKEICETIGMDKVMYQNSGAEANEANDQDCP